MSLIKWAVGLLAFQIVIVILLIGIAPIFSNATFSDEEVVEMGFNSSSTIDVSDLGMFDKFSYSVDNLPFPLNYLIWFPVVIGVIIGLAYLRGVN